jgi:hypothetical protein
MSGNKVVFSLAQRRVLADVSRRIFGHVGYVGHTVPTGRKALKRQLQGPRHMSWYDESIPAELGEDQLTKRARNYEKFLGKRIKEMGKKK